MYKCTYLQEHVQVLVESIHNKSHVYFSFIHLLAVYGVYATADDDDIENNDDDGTSIICDDVIK